MAERAEAERAESWNPKEHQEHPRLIAGLVLERRLRRGMGFEGADVETVLIHEPEGKDWLLWLFGTVLENEFAGIQPGDVVAVKHEGHKEGGRGTKGYEGFRVSVDQAARQPVATTVEEQPHEPTEPAPPAADVAVCEQCGFAGGKHAAGCPGKPEPVKCESCGFVDGHHAAGCPNDIPF